MPGGRLLAAVEVMNRLRSPGGCPWDAEQTHDSLVPYLIEEAHEAVEAIEAGDRSEMVDELGDVLLQVLFHARIGQEHPSEPFSVDDVADRLVAKLTRRHPHVFADVEVTGAAEVVANWEQIKAAEKPDRTAPLDGIPAGLPELARAAKAVSRLDRAGELSWLEGWLEEQRASAAPGRALAVSVLAEVIRAREVQVDLPSALRSLLRDLETDSAQHHDPDSTL